MGDLSVRSSINSSFLKCYKFSVFSLLRNSLYTGAMKPFRLKGGACLRGMVQLILEGAKTHPHPIIRSISMHFRGRVSKLRWYIERYIRLNELSLGPIKPTPEIPAMGTV